MKTQISRRGHQDDRRYSGVYQQQGRMMSDADWNEQADLVRERRREALNDAVGSGSPREEGMAADVPDSSGDVQLHWGRVYAAGVAAEVRPGESVDPAAPEFDYAEQREFPDPPDDAAKKLLYVDVWERTISAVEDELLKDPALHGADTCTRLETIAQVKRAAAATDVIDEDKNPTIGTAVLGLKLRTEVTVGDRCDPCERELEVEQRIGNYLFRLEIHHVEGPVDHPDVLELTWSSENAAEALTQKQDPPAGFYDGSHVYEFHDRTTERHLGAQLAGGAGFPKRSTLGTQSADAPADAEFVRRWDGSCRLEKSGSGWTLESGSDLGQSLDTGLGDQEHGYVAEAPLMNGESLQIKLQKLALSLNLKDRRFVAGDYWLATVRERGPKTEAEDERIRHLPPDGSPTGIRHHYLVLGTDLGAGKIRVEAGQPIRGLRFPPLTDLTAGDVGYAAQHPCDSGLFDASHDTVQKALDELCELSADNVGYTPDPECKVLAGATDVQEALDQLCKRETGVQCKMTVGPGADFENLDEALSAVKDGQAVCLCLLPGEHLLEKIFDIKAPGAVVSIHACPGSVTITVGGNWTWAGLTSAQLDGVKVKFASQDHHLAFEGCTRVAISRSVITGVISAEALVKISGGETVRIDESIIDAQQSVSGQMFIPVFQPVELLVDTLNQPNDNLFSAEVINVSHGLLAQPRAERKKASREIRERLETAGITKNQRGRGETFLNLFEKPNVNGVLLTNEIIELRRASRNQKTACALLATGISDRLYLDKVKLGGCVRFVDSSVVGLEWVEAQARPSAEGMIVVENCGSFEARSSVVDHLAPSGQTMVAQIVAEVDAELARPFLTTSGVAFRQTMWEVNDYLVDLKHSERHKIGKKIREVTGQSSNFLLADQTAALEEFADRLEKTGHHDVSVEDFYPPTRAKLEGDQPRLGLVFLDAKAETALNDVEIDGDLSTYGASSGEDIADQFLERPGGNFKHESLRSTGKSLRIDGCRMDRVLIGKQMLLAIVTGFRNGKKLELRGLYSTLQLNESRIRQPISQLVARTLTLGHTRFARDVPVCWAITVNGSAVANFTDGSKDSHLTVFSFDTFEHGFNARLNVREL